MARLESYLGGTGISRRAQFESGLWHENGVKQMSPERFVAEDPLATSRKVHRSDGGDDVCRAFDKWVRWGPVCGSNTADLGAVNI